MKKKFAGMEKVSYFCKNLKLKVMMKKVLLSLSALAFVSLMVGCSGGPAAEGKALAKKACECQTLSKDDTKAAEAEACIEEWGEMLKAAYEKYENDEEKMKEFIAGGDSYECDK